MIDVNAVAIKITGVEDDEARDIKRCLTTLYSIREGEQPLDREFGLNHEFIDQPVPIAKNMLALEIIEKTQKYERRVIVERVDYETSKEGQIIPMIYLKRSDETWR